MQEKAEFVLSMQDRHLVELVKKYQAGDRGAYDRIYSLSVPGVYYLVNKMVRDTHEAQDITQEIFLTVYQNLKTLKEPQTFKKWLNRTAWCETMDYIKSNKCKSTAGSDFDALEEMDSFDPSAVGEDSELLAAERRDAVMKAVDSLNPNVRMTVILKFFRDCKEKEIAEIMDVPLGTVKRRLMLAKDQLSGKLTGVYSVFPFFFVRLAAMRQCRTALPDHKGAVADGIRRGKKGAVAAGAAAGVAAAVVLQGPVIQNLKYYSQNSYVNHQSVEWTVKSALPVKSAVVEGKPWKVTVEGKNCSVAIPENGTFVLAVTDAAGQTAHCTVEINNIDSEGPLYRDYAESGDSMILTFSDALSGINWDRTVFLKEDGTQAEPEAVDREKGQVRLSSEQFPLKAQIEDMAGNYGIFDLKLNTTEYTVSGEAEKNGAV